MNKHELFAHFKAAMKKLCVQHAEVDKCVWEGDPYEWAHGALCTISAEGTLPIDFYTNDDNRLLVDTCNLTLKKTGVDVWYEWVNCGVVAIYD